MLDAERSQAQRLGAFFGPLDIAILTGNRSRWNRPVVAGAICFVGIKMDFDAIFLSDVAIVRRGNLNLQLPL